MAKRGVLGAGMLETVSGGDWFEEGQDAGQARLESPQGLALDGAGNLYIADKLKGRIYVRRADRKLYLFAGRGATEFGGDGGPAKSAGLHQTYGLAFGRDGALYVADCGNRRVRRIGADGRIETVLGTGGVAPAPLQELRSPGRAGTSVPLADPFLLHLDATEQLWVSDCAGKRVYRFDPATGQAVVMLSAEQGLQYPAGLARVGEQLLVADRIGRNILALDLRSGAVESWMGGVRNAPRVDFTMPLGLVYDGQRYLYLSDAGRGLIFRIEAATRTAEVYAGAGTKYVGGIDRRELRLRTPGPLALGANGTLYVSEVAGNGGTHRGVLAIRADGQVSIAAGRFLSEFDPRAIGDGGPAQAGRLSHPRGVAVDATGNVYVSDSNHRRIRKVVQATGRLETVAGRGWGIREDLPWPACAALGGAPQDAFLISPRGLAFAPSGELYVVDAGHRALLRISHDFSRIECVVRDERLGAPYNLALGPGGVVYLDDRKAQVLWKVDAQGGLAVYAGQAGQAGFAGDGGPATQALLHTPSGVALGPGGEVYFGDAGNNRVRVIRGGVVSTFAGTGRRGTGCPDGPALQADLDRPRVLAVGAGGQVYVCDYERRVVRIEPGTGQLRQLAGGLQYGYAGDGGPANGVAQLTDIEALAIAGADLYLADSANHALRRVVGAA